MKSTKKQINYVCQFTFLTKCQSLFLKKIINYYVNIIDKFEETNLIEYSANFILDTFIHRFTNSTINNLKNIIEHKIQRHIQIQTAKQIADHRKLKNICIKNIFLFNTNYYKICLLEVIEGLTRNNIEYYQMKNLKAKILKISTDHFYDNQKQYDIYQEL